MKSRLHRYYQEHNRDPAWAQAITYVFGLIPRYSQDLKLGEFAAANDHAGSSLQSVIDQIKALQPIHEITLGYPPGIHIRVTNNGGVLDLTNRLQEVVQKFKVDSWMLDYTKFKRTE